MHRSSTEMVHVVASEGYCKLVCDPDAWMISWLQAVSCLNAQKRLWTACRLMDELDETLNRELDVLYVDLRKIWKTNNEFRVTAR